MTEDQSLAGRWGEWLRARWSAFVALEGTILDLQHRAAVAAAQARERGDQEGYAEGVATIRRLGELGRQHLQALDRLRELAGVVPGLQGLGAFPLVPLAWAAAVISVGTAVAWIFGRVGAEERVVRLLEAGRLTAGEARDILENIETSGPGQSLGDSLRWVMLGLLGWVALRTVQEARR